MSSTSKPQQCYYKLIQLKYFPDLYNHIYKNFLNNNNANISAALEEALSFPHSWLDEIWRCYQAFQDYPNYLAAFEKYKKSKKLYEKIIEVEKDAKAWFKCLLEVGDEEFVIQNVESKIEELDLELWHAYIKYLHIVDINAAHEVYTRYINRFLDDASLDNLFKDYSPRITRFKKEYIKTRCNSIKPWERSYSPPPPPPRRSRKRKHGEATTPQMIRYSNVNQIQQCFSLPFHTMNSIIANANPSVLEKLYRCCKYFYGKRPLPILRTLIVDKFVKRGQKSASNNALTVLDSNLDSLPSKICVTMALHIKPCSLHSIFSTISQRIGNSEIRFLRIYSQEFTLAEFEHFINPNLLEFIYLEDVDILENEIYYAPFDKIIALLPAAKFIEFHMSSWYRPEAFDNLVKLKRINKLKHFVISRVTTFYAIHFHQYVKKHLENGSNVCLEFDKNVSNKKFLRFYQTSNHLFKNCLLRGITLNIRKA